MADVDPNVWIEKDRKIVKQSMLKAAVELAKNQEGVTPENVMAIADKFVAWVYNKETKAGVKTETKSNPVPTPIQKGILDTFKEKYGFTPEQVIKAFGRYPDNTSEAKKCLDKLKG